MTTRSDASVAPIVVVGGGPGGLATAAELAFHGVSSVLLEPRTEVSHLRPRAKTTSPRTMEHFRRWGIADEIRRRAPLTPAWNRRVVFCDRLDGTVITEFHEVFGLSAEPHELFAEAGQQVPQPVVEEVLRQHLHSTGLVDMRFGERATAVVEDADSVTITIERADGSTYQQDALYVVGSDGGGSLCRAAIGATLEGTSAQKANLNVVFRSPTLRPVMGDALHYWVIGSQTPGAVGPLDREGLWWASLAGVGDDPDAQKAAELVAALAGDAVAAADIEILALDPWTPRMLLADHFSSARIFLVGESAHLNPPFGGHGFNTCIGDAVNIGWKLAAVLNGWGGAGLLETYELERRPVAEATIASAARNLKATGLDLARTSDALQRTKSEEFYSLGLTLGYSYAGSPLISGASRRVQPEPVEDYVPSTEPGSRLPHAWVSPGHALYDDLGREFSLVAPSGQGNDPAVAGILTDAARLGVPVAVLPDSAVSGAGEWLLVRPDQHIAWRGSRLEGLDLARAAGASPPARRSESAPVGHRILCVDPDPEGWPIRGRRRF